MNCWTESVLGKPWVRGARGPDKFDCYGLIWWVRKCFFNQNIPRLEWLHFKNLSGLTDIFKEHVSGWDKIETPVEGCAVALSRFPKFGIHHCGVWTDADEGLIIHAEDFNNVRAQSIQDLRLYGWKIIDFYEYNN